MSRINRRRAITAGVVSGAAILIGASRSRGQEKANDAVMAKAELVSLQGTWKCLRWEQEGVQMAEADAARVSIVVAGDKYKSTTDGTSFEEGKLIVDPTRTPCHLDGHIGGDEAGPTDPHLGGRHGGDVRRAIYVRAGEYLTMCVGPSGRDWARPVDFVTAPGKDSVSLYVFKIKR